MAKPAEKEMHVVTVVRHGEKLIVPEIMTYDAAIESLQRQKRYEEEYIQISETVDVSPFDGAIQLKEVMARRFGLVFHKGAYGGMAQEVSVESGVGETTTVPWGEFKIPGTEGNDKLMTDVGTIEDRMVFQINAIVRRKYDALVRGIIKDVREAVKTKSIYRGKALRIKFHDGNGNLIPMVQPRFLDLNRLNKDEIVYSAKLTRSIQTNIMTPLRHTDLVRKAGTPLKRGVLLSGPYGTGKTLLAYWAAQEAVPNGWTFIYLEDVRDLPHAIRFGQQYGKTLIFGEDIDRAVSGPRTAELDKIFNLLDGIDTKHSDLMVVLTTNHIEAVHAAMKRPGRLDVVLNIMPPDAEAVERLLKVYLRALINPLEDLSVTGKLLAGKIPAVIREVAERSKLEYIRRTGTEIGVGQIVGEDLQAAAETMLEQIKLISDTTADAPLSPASEFGKALGEALGAEVGDSLLQVVGYVRDGEKFVPQAA
jgi:transitional endoplasmic reticulum ATPase